MNPCELYKDTSGTLFADQLLKKSKKNRSLTPSYFHDGSEVV